MKKKECLNCRFWHEYGTVEITKNSLTRKPYKIGDCHCEPKIVYNKRENDTCRFFENGTQLTLDEHRDVYDE
ncbi:MAG: hypothetical protein MUP81_00505 [Dehalococcoidia bacterium]|nr:hypothetical protein [Dehalococcoidia bacterium]